MINARIPVADDDAVRRIAVAEHVSVSEVLRRAIVFEQRRVARNARRRAAYVRKATL